MTHFRLSIALRLANFGWFCSTHQHNNSCLPASDSNSLFSFHIERRLLTKKQIKIVWNSRDCVVLFCLLLFCLSLKLKSTQNPNTSRQSIRIKINIHLLNNSNQGKLNVMECEVHFVNCTFYTSSIIVRFILCGFFFSTVINVLRVVLSSSGAGWFWCGFYSYRSAYANPIRSVDCSSLSTWLSPSTQT